MSRQAAGSRMASFRLEPIENLPTCLERYFARTGRNIIPSRLARVLLALVGTCIEGHEMFCCVLVPFPGEIPDLTTFGTSIALPGRTPSDFVLPWQLGSGEHYARHIRSLRTTIGRTGDAVELVAVLGNRGDITRLLLLRDGVTPRDLSKLGDVVFIQPKACMWIYSNRQEVCQVLKLRDGTGWAARDVVEQRRCFRSIYGSIFKSEETAANILHTSWLASSQGHGIAVFLLNCNPAEYQKFRDLQDSIVANSLQLAVPIRFSSARELLRLAMLDGATFVSGQGQIVDSCVYLRGPGGRHDAALYAVNKAAWLKGAIIVSQDGPISWYETGSNEVVGGDQVRFL